VGAKNLATPGFESRTVQPVESRCTDYAVQTNAVFGTISNENMAEGRTCEAGATWQQLGSALGSQQFKTLKLSRNCNHFGHGRIISIKYYECVFVALVIQHAIRMRHIVIFGPVRLYCIFPLYLMNGRILEKKLFNIKCVF